MKKLLLVPCALIISFCLFAQTAEEQPENNKGFQKERLFAGGNFGLTFGDYTLINISPQVGYRFSQRFAAGVGLNAQYVSYKERYLNGDAYRKVAQNVTGLNVFARLYPLKQFFFTGSARSKLHFWKTNILWSAQAGV